MRLLILLNARNLWRFPGGLPEALAAAASERGHRATVRITRSADHAESLVSAAASRGFDGIFSGGGDGTLHHLANHPAVRSMAISPLPMGTVNAFLDALGADLRDPLNSFRQLLRGGPAPGWCGTMNGRRFACFASIGFDARVVHGNSVAVKRWLRRYSYGVAAVAEFARPWRAVPGILAAGGALLRTSSLIVSRIANYAGFRCFQAHTGEPVLEGLSIAADSVLSVLRLAADVARCGPARGLPPPPGVRRHRFASAQWSAPRPAVIQLDGEETVLPGTRRLEIGIDPHPQRFFLPA